MDKKTKKRIKVFVKDLQKALRLKDWTITVNFKEKAGSDAYAVIDPLAESRHAEVRVSKKFLDLSEEIQRQTLIHELMHCHLFFIDGAMAHVFEKTLSKKQRKIVDRVLTTEIERATDSLADAFATQYKRKY
jgi:predicted metallopeptidase